MTDIKDVRKQLAGDLVGAMIADQDRVETESYLRLGRDFRDTPRETLERDYAVAFKLVLVDGVAQLTSLLDDLGAELRLRGLPEPEHLIGAWRPAVLKRAQDILRDPQACSTLDEKIRTSAQGWALPKKKDHAL